MYRYDPYDVSITNKILSSSGLNKTEMHRILKQLFFKGYVDDEAYYQKLQCVIIDDPSGIHVHVQYEWKKIPNRDEDNNRYLKLKYMKRTK